MTNGSRDKIKSAASIFVLCFFLINFSYVCYLSNIRRWQYNKPIKQNVSYNHNYDPDIIVVQNKNTSKNGQRNASDSVKEAGWIGIPFDGWVAIFTAWLAVATTGLWLFTGFLWSSTKDAVNDSINATKIANKEFIASHRPRLRLRRITITNLKINEHVEILAEVANIGDTPAIIQQFGADAYVSKIYHAAVIDMKFPELLPGLQLNIGWKCPSVMSERDIINIKNSAVVLNLLGCINYFDENGTMRSTSFARVFDIHLDRFVAVRPSHPESDRDYEN